MDGLVCDGCGEPLLLDDDVRYVLRVEGFAAQWDKISDRTGDAPFNSGMEQSMHAMGMLAKAAGK